VGQRAGLEIKTDGGGCSRGHHRGRQFWIYWGLTKRVISGQIVILQLGDVRARMGVHASFGVGAVVGGE